MVVAAVTEVMMLLANIYTGEITYDSTDKEAHYFHWKYSDELHGTPDSKGQIRVEHKEDGNVYIKAEGQDDFVMDCSWLAFMEFGLCFDE
ncbi:hypothetical protein BK126_26160 [Paenibacillus sp. FSL H7-0326]|uniref:hypothetical protein n=1 Tax=Paenibacillus sp. FSL H7-0326 TaxID=1921144 RepID=UPI00096C3BB7|nr:hypothetical protein [Paenibacillus sp. FSL H7-0326]OMC63681.1 hypothetical protein BK126_26160 [Paenibacillus sp. FSL H7-0326]